MNIYYFYNVDNLVVLYLDGFGFSIGQILTYFISNLIRYTKIITNKSNDKMKNYIKDYYILFLIDCFYMVNNLLPYFLPEADYSSLYTNDAIQIIFLTLITYFFLKYKYYIHHFISIAIFVILNVIIDVILGNFIGIHWGTILSSIVYIIADSFIYSYFKYLIVKKYYFFMDVLFFLGIFNFIVHSISIVILVIIHKSNGINDIIFQFYSFYNEYGTGYMLTRFFFGLICTGIMVGILEFAIINELTPNYVIIGYTLSEIPSTIIGIEGNNRWIILVISIFQIFSLLFYLEILELNFCSLNKNTKKNIISRIPSEAQIDIEERIIIDGYDITENIKNQETEMAKMDEDKEESEDTLK